MEADYSEQDALINESLARGQHEAEVIASPDQVQIACKGLLLKLAEGDERMKAKSGRARMPWNGDIAHTKLSDGRVALRGSHAEAIDRYGDELVAYVASHQRLT